MNAAFDGRQLDAACAGPALLNEHLTLLQEADFADDAIVQQSGCHLGGKLAVIEEAGDLCGAFDRVEKLIESLIFTPSLPVLGKEDCSKQGDEAEQTHYQQGNGRTAQGKARAK